jgi:hypothetical protein
MSTPVVVRTTNPAKATASMRKFRFERFMLSRISPACFSERKVRHPDLVTENQSHREAARIRYDLKIHPKPPPLLDMHLILGSSKIRDFRRSEGGEEQQEDKPNGDGQQGGGTLLVLELAASLQVVAERKIDLLGNQGLSMKVARSAFDISLSLGERVGVKETIMAHATYIFRGGAGIMIVSLLGEAHEIAPAHIRDGHLSPRRVGS